MRVSRRARARLRLNHHGELHHGGMEILLWLAPAAVVTGLAMLWAGWVGRERTDGPGPA